MSLPIVLRPEARSEFDDAFDWYEQRRPGLGEDFVAQVQEVFDRISATPELYAPLSRSRNCAIIVCTPPTELGAIKRMYLSLCWA